MQNYVIPIIISFCFLGLFYFASKAKVIIDDNGKFVLKYPLAIRLFGSALLLGGFMGTVIIINTAIQKSDPNATALIITCICFFIILPLCLVIEFVYVKFIVDNEKICTHSPWSNNREIYWSKVTKIRYSQASRWFIIHSNEVKPVRVMEWVAGVNEMFQIIEKNVPSYILDDFVKHTK